MSGPASPDARAIASALVAGPPPTAPGAPGPALPAKPPPVAPSAPVDPSVAAALAVPVDTSAPPTQPEALKPQAPVRKKPPKVVPGKPSRTPQKGDLICGECGEANVPARKFCSRCGTTLATATKAKIHWWTRLAGKFRRKDLRAGERPWEEQGTKVRKPKKRGFAKVFLQVRRIAGIVLLVGGLLYGVYEPFRTKVNSVYNSAKDKVTSVIHPKFDNVTVAPGTFANTDPAQVPAECPPNSADPLQCHNGVSAVDGFKNTYWLTSSPPPQGTTIPTLDVQLAEKTDVERIIVHNGAFDNFQGFDRPKTLQFVFDTGQQYEVELKNSPDEQKLAIKHGGGVLHFQIRVLDTYVSINQPEGNALMAITEIEFATKK